MFKVYKSKLDKIVIKKNDLNVFCICIYKNLWFKSVYFNMCSIDWF